MILRKSQTKGRKLEWNVEGDSVGGTEEEEEEGKNTQGDDDVLMFDRARREGRVVFVYYPFCTLQLGLSSNVQ